jgi:hypothetical protein
MVFQSWRNKLPILRSLILLTYLNAQQFRLDSATEKLDRDGQADYETISTQSKAESLAIWPVHPG